MPHKRAKKSVRDAEKAAKGYNLPPSASSSRSADDTPRSASRIFNAITSRNAFKAAGRTSSEDTGERGVKRKRNQVSGVETENKLGESSSSVLRSSKGKEKESSVPKIRDNESLAEYNRRVEAALRLGVSQAIKSAGAIKAQQEREFREAKKARKAEAAVKYKANREKELREGDIEDQDDDVQEGLPEKSTTVSVKRKDKGPKPVKHDISDPAIEFKSAPAPRRLNDIVQAPPILPHLKAAKSQPKKSTTGSGWTSTGRNPLSLAQQRLLADERDRVVKAYREIKAGREEKREKEKEKERVGSSNS